MPCLSIAPSKGRKNRKAVVFLRAVQAESPGEITALSDRYGPQTVLSCLDNQTKHRKLWLGSGY